MLSEFWINCHKNVLCYSICHIEFNSLVLFASHINACDEVTLNTDYEMINNSWTVLMTVNVIFTLTREKIVKNALFSKFYRNLFRGKTQKFKGILLFAPSKVLLDPHVFCLRTMMWYFSSFSTLEFSKFFFCFRLNRLSFSFFDATKVNDLSLRLPLGGLFVGKKSRI